MPCYHPITALQPTAGGPLVFDRPEHFKLYNDYRTVQITCGQCKGCRLTRSRHWAIRCMHEKQMHKHACYITLTFQGEKFKGATLDHAYYAAFMRKLRKAAFRGWRRARQEKVEGRPIAGPAVPRNLYGPSLLIDGDSTTPPKLRFYMGGEYGELYGRPHFHALIYGLDFVDKQLYRTSLKGHHLYTSKTLTALWKHGLATVGELTFESAAYVARYVMKKKTGDGDKSTYSIIDPETGEIHRRKKEYNTMSRRSGIGASWFEKYNADVYSALGKVIIRGGIKHNPPRYYDKLYKKIDAAALEGYKHARYIEALAHKEHHTPERLAVQEQVTEARTRNLNRNFTAGD